MGNEEWKAWFAFVFLMSAPILVIVWAVACCAILG